MKKTKYIYHILNIIFILGCIKAGAQYSQIQYLRPNDKNGLNKFESGKQDTVPFDGLKVRIGGNFSQDFQGLRNHNNAQSVIVDGVNQNLPSPFNKRF